jgi:hypothetical protein
MSGHEPGSPRQGCTRADRCSVCCISVLCCQFTGSPLITHVNSCSRHFVYNLRMLSVIESVSSGLWDPSSICMRRPLSIVG